VIKRGVYDGKFYIEQEASVETVH